MWSGSWKARAMRAGLTWRHNPNPRLHRDEQLGQKPGELPAMPTPTTLLPVCPNCGQPLGVCECDTADNY